MWRNVGEYYIYVFAFVLMFNVLPLLNLYMPVYDLFVVQLDTCTSTVECMMSVWDMCLPMADRNGSIGLAVLFFCQIGARVLLVRHARRLVRENIVLVREDALEQGATCPICLEDLDVEPDLFWIC